MSKIIGYTTGVYDMFHIGHLNILKKSKEIEVLKNDFFIEKSKIDNELPVHIKLFVRINRIRLTAIVVWLLKLW